MLTKTKIALALALVAGSASVASAQGFDPNPANRYPVLLRPRRHGAALYRDGRDGPRRAASRRRTSPRAAHCSPRR